MDRRTTIKWMLAASAAWPAWRTAVGQVGHGTALRRPPAAPGYGTDPDLVTPHKRGEFWPLTLSVAQRQLAAVLSDLIIPADEHSPSASSVGVVDFIDEWVSAPYPTQQRGAVSSLPHRSPPRRPGRACGQHPLDRRAAVHHSSLRRMRSRI